MVTKKFFYTCLVTNVVGLITMASASQQTGPSNELEQMLQTPPHFPQGQGTASQELLALLQTPNPNGNAGELPSFLTTAQPAPANESLNQFLTRIYTTPPAPTTGSGTQADPMNMDVDS